MKQYSHIPNSRGFIDQGVSQPTLQRRINVVLMFWINVQIPVTRRSTWNKTRSRIFNVAQNWCDATGQHWNNVETRLHYGFVNRWIVFIQLNEEIFFSNNSITNRILKKFSTVVHIVIQNGGSNSYIYRSLKQCIQKFKSFLKKY